MINLTATFTAKQGKQAILRDILLKMVKVSRQEAGCVRYCLYEDAKQSHILVFQEQFIDQDAFDHHCKMPYFISLLNEIQGIVEKDPDIQFFKQVEPAASV
ncbi:antibiotic biosynthesis monooxygenase [Edwardsiella hoshinae]|uniref:Antibiotic biosynthesis monooxygenase n=1 Tax=Edwardsiella hoshinae TaxID=93378 RepID=A0A376DG63_9GAMM|nr:putative quinol monooxygenase [Edwardsiella hoshinae]AOV96839.1 antibiotic biosynthesis monooxygenase [Edwardsiella hoshinae]QPR27286.1 antibiotic biosynthesis monooxygenase [Edwardsiella hoshinae]STC87871.1 Antibiotic biosynthesis monooxygenase [Edwardsiella hoshinae]